MHYSRINFVPVLTSFTADSTSDLNDVTDLLLTVFLNSISKMFDIKS
jgi:hypothetical protein